MAYPTSFHSAPRSIDAASHTVDFDSPCSRCGYNLRTLACDGLCPECGHGVGDSLRSLLVWPSSLPGTARAMQVWVAGVVLCTAAMLLVWLYLRFWYPLSLHRAWMSDRSVSRGVFRALLVTDLLGGLIRIAAALMLVAAVRPSARVGKWLVSGLLGVAGLVTAIVAVTVFFPSWVPRPQWNDWYMIYVKDAPAALWLSVLYAWVAMNRRIRREQAPSLRRAAGLGIFAAAILSISSTAYAVVASTSGAWWSDHPLWSSRFFVWSGNGAIEKTAEVLLLAAALAFIRQGRRPRSGAGSPVAV